MKKLLVFVLSLALVFSLASCSSDSETETTTDSTNTTDTTNTDNTDTKVEMSKFLAIGTAGTGGAYYPIGIAIADIFTNELGTPTSAEVTGGAAENNLLVNDDTVQLAITQGPMAFAALNGTTPYEAKNANLATLFNGLSKGVFHVVVMGNSDIYSYSDLKGKTIAMGPAGGGAINVALDILSVYGLGMDDIKPTYLAYSEGVDALKDGNVDAAIIQSAAPAAAITQLAASTTDFRIISIEDDKLQDVLDKYSYYSSMEIPSTMYGNNTDSVVIYLSNMVVVSTKLSEEEVYLMTKAIFENLDLIHDSHPAAKGLTLETAVDRVPIPLHPGAERYFREVGAIK